MPVRTMMLRTSDGHDLEADRAQPDGAPVAAAVVCHPHPLFGGNRFNPVVDAVFRSLPAAGIAALRFDFRSAHDHGDAERLDVIAAIDALVELDTPLFLVGYSFGALVSLSTADARVAGIVALAPPLATDAAAPHAPTLVITPRHDQYCSPETTGAITSGWSAVEIDVLEGADHFMHGHTGRVAARVTDWLLARAAG